jgi:cobalt-zinc-cadmium efflux system membrane fusion protein
MVSFLILTGCPREEAAAPEKPLERPSRQKSGHDLVNLDDDALRDLRLTTTRARRQRATEEVLAFGEIALHEDAAADVVAPLPAVIERLAAPIGARVSKGQTLAVLRSPDLGRARAEIIATNAQIHAAEQHLTRQVAVVAAGVAPKRAEEQARMELAVARASQQAALAKLGALAVGLEVPKDPERMARFVLRAPRSGTVSERPVLPGAAAPAGGLIYRIADLRRLWLIAHVYERESVRLRPGMPARVTLPAFPGDRFEGRVAVSTGIVDASSRTVVVRVSVADPKRRLRPGMAASAAFAVAMGAKAIVTVPVAAVQRVEGAWSVFLPRTKTSFERREVARGRELGGDLEILRGLREGEEVVVEGAFLLAAEAARTHETGEHH